MNGILVRLVITAVGLALAEQLVSGIRVEDTLTLIFAAIGLGIVNAIVRPIAVVLTIPITILSLGLFLWVINAGMLSLTSAFVAGFEVASFGSALIGAAIVSLTGWIGNAFVGDGGRFEVVEIEARRR